MGPQSLHPTNYAESEIKFAGGTSRVYYTYDGDGNRVYKSNGKIYWYGAGTEILDETNLSGTVVSEYVFLGGKRVARRNSDGVVYYYAEDMLGSSRTDRGLPGRRLVEPGGSVQAGQTSLCYDGDFYPFGGERIIMNSCAQNYKFEGKERDTESGNDDFGARYYSSRMGRWLSADWSSVPVPVPYANLSNPQTLNLYAMVSDNPETFADLDGHGPPADPSTCAPNGSNCQAVAEQQANNQLTQDKGATQTSQTAKEQADQQKQNRPSAATVGAAVGAVAGGVVGAVVGAVGGAAVGTAVEPGGGTLVVGIAGGTEGAQTGAEMGAVAGAAAGALAPTVYSKTKELAETIGKHVGTAVDHLDKLKGPDWQPRKSWRDTLRRVAGNIDKLSNKIPNKTIRELVISSQTYSVQSWIKREISRG